MSKYFISFSLFFASVACGSVSTPYDRAAEHLAKYVAMYATEHTNSVTSWSDIEKYSPGFEGLNILLSPGATIEDEFIFIPLEQRTNFPDGELILIGANPQAWPEAWKDVAEVAEESVGLQQADPKEDSIRYLIYRDHHGRIRSQWWREERVQRVLGQVGIDVPLGSLQLTPARVSKPVKQDAVKVEADALTEKGNMPPIPQSVEEPVAVAPVIEEPYCGNRNRRGVLPLLVGLIAILVSVGLWMFRRRGGRGRSR